MPRESRRNDVRRGACNAGWQTARGKKESSLAIAIEGEYQPGYGIIVLDADGQTVAELQDGIDIDADELEIQMHGSDIDNLAAVLAQYQLTAAQAIEAMTDAIERARQGAR